jgi:hypothetical protein
MGSYKKEENTKMKRLIVFSFVVLAGIIFFSASNATMQDIKYSRSKIKMPGDQSSSGTVLKRNPDFGNIPLYFIPNQGQVNEKARFYAKTSRYTLWMTKEGLIFDSIRKTKVEADAEGIKTPGPQENIKEREGIHHSSFITHHSSFNRDVSRLFFLDSSRNPEMAPIELTQHKVNYLKGNDPSQWKTNIQTSKAVIYKNLYKNIDLKVYGVEKQIEYDWIIKPGGDPRAIRFQYKNVKSTCIDERGNLLIETQLGELIHKRPVSYQEISIEPKREHRVYVHVDVNVEFKKIDENTYGFDVGYYDKSCGLIIDPVVMAYSTFLGGSEDDYGYALAVDSSGSAYVTGETSSTDFPIDDAYQNPFGGGNDDAFVTKFSTSGSSLVYSTYLGGSNNESGEGIQVDSSGKAYVTGYTHSTDFPTQSAFQGTHGGGDKDAFVTVLSSSGSSLIFSTYLGGSGTDIGYALALGSSGNIYVTGQTASTNFPTQNAYTASYRGGDCDAFVTKFSVSGSSLVYSTYLGGPGKDEGYGIVTSSSGNAYVVGRTTSSNFPVQNAYQTTHGGGDYDAFVTKFSTSGTSLIYSTYLGGNQNDSGWGIAVDSSGSAYATGDTYSTDFPTQNAYQSSHAGGGKDAFVTKFSVTGTTAVYSTYLGGLEVDASAHVVVNSSGNAYVTGVTQSSDFPVKRAYQGSYNGNYDAFVSMFSTTGNSLIFSTFLGGSDQDTARAIAIDSSGNIYVAGFTESPDFPTENPYQDTLNGDMDAFVGKFSTAEFGSLGGAVDNCNLTWTTGGNANWFEQTVTYYYDGDAAESGNIGDSESTYIQTTVTGPGTLSFWWKVSSSSYYDRLYFYIDGDSQTYISGTTGSWTQETYDISSGTHTLKWSYEKNPSYSYGLDCGWLDKVEYLPDTTIILNRTQLTFGAVQGSTTGSQTFSISSNAGILNWSVNANKSWIDCSPTSGIGFGVVTVSVNPTGLAKGTYTGTITVSDPNATNSPQTVSVTLNVYGTGKSSVPFGEYATPTHNSTIRSSVPFTGWVLDDLGVVSVKLYRHSGGSLVYIGDAIFVDGARPDVEQAYPDYPYNYKAGWGYMMLTNFLPNGGNGTFIIDAIATDVEGHHVTLGSKTVIVDNANAVKPFGAIDTPTQGGSASGTNFRNQGWVLTPLPNAIPVDGSTIEVYIDGIMLGNPIYNLYRADVATLFPGYANSNGALAYFDFDTTTYTNGVHTIMWIATDDASNADGIGSRYFSIQNAGAKVQQSLLMGHGSLGNNDLSRIPVDDSSPVAVIKGFNRNVEPFENYPDDNGRIRIEIKELERIEVRLFPVGTAGLAPLYSGYQVIGDRLAPLPIGSTLDIQRGIFYWQPGPGYVGKYWLVFIEEDQYGNMTRRDITFNIMPKF